MCRSSRLVTDRRLPAQNGHPKLWDVRHSVMWRIGARHSWSDPLRHFHQNSFREPAARSSGISPPFFVGCHRRRLSGKSFNLLPPIGTLSVERFFRMTTLLGTSIIIRQPRIAVHGADLRKRLTFLAPRSTMQSSVRLRLCHAPPHRPIRVI